ncbi:semaphorin-4A-like isoform X2 [Hoplias malabaricus]|uniref:semaphorin-4A-like isoform X2 n=1 Tax=Hoplias malabaricus TaxID=27720 RepID=UPI003462B19B
MELWLFEITQRNMSRTWEMKNCANFIRVLQFINSTHLYACGSFAFKPADIILTVDNLSVSREAQRAKGLCPYKGSERNTALFVDGELYTATTNDFAGADPVISRYFSNGRADLSLEKLSTTLSDPTFISSTYIPSERKVLFFFREEGAEYKFMERFTVSRVAQVCRDDNGGTLTLQKRWTTFAKSQLICQTEKQLPLNLLQDIVMVPPGDDESPDNTLFYGIFTSQWPLTSSQSAVCVFTLSDIKTAFTGNYKSFTNQWTDEPNTDGNLGNCKLNSESDTILNLVKKTFLTASHVYSVGKNQLLTSREEYSRITAQRVKAANGHKYSVLYLLTESGFLHKAVLLKNRTHIIEEIQVFKPPQTLKSIIVSVTKGVVFIGFSEGVVRVPVANCSYYPSCAECVLARDPFCGWDPQDKVCVLVSNMKPNLHQDVDNGNVSEQCDSFEKENSPRLQNEVHLNQLVMLPCHSRSRLAKVSWRFSNHSIVPMSLYLQNKDGSLVVNVTPSTAMEFHCVTEEQGFQQTAVIFSLKLCLYQKSHYNGLVAVSILLAICICVIAVGAVLWWRKHQNKADLQCQPFQHIVT